MLGDQRAAVTIDSGLSDEDLAAIVDADKRATRCTDAMIRAHWQQDIVNRFSAQAHFDNCKINPSLVYLRAEYARADSAAATNDVATALRHLGHVLHSVEDFFAHTNFVELAAEEFEVPANVPALVLWDASSDALLAPFKPRLVSGRMIWHGDSGACRPLHGVMNKDSPDSERGGRPLERWKMTHYRATLELTRRACGKLLRETMLRPSWAAVRQACGTTVGFSLKVDHRREE